MTTTEEKLIEMLTENTGSHFLDSGEAYGRHWQRNQGRDFAAEDSAVVEFGVNKPYRNGKWVTFDAEGNVFIPTSQRDDRGVNTVWVPDPDPKPTLMDRLFGLMPKDNKVDAVYTKSTFYFLSTALYYDEAADKEFQEWLDLPENEDDHWLALMEKWAEKQEGKGIYGEGNYITVNTYNGEDALDQTLQYTYYTTEDGVYILLQVHGGCDVRGGYTRPVLFTSGEYEEAIFDNARGDLWCEVCQSAWYTDDAYHWYGQNDEDDLDKVRLSVTGKHLPLLNSAVQMVNRMRGKSYRARNKVAERLNKIVKPLVKYMTATQRVPVPTTKGTYDFQMWTHIALRPRMSKWADKHLRFSTKRTKLLKGVAYVNEDDHTCTCPVCGKGTIKA